MERRSHDAWDWGFDGVAIDIGEINISRTLNGCRLDQCE